MSEADLPVVYAAYLRHHAPKLGPETIEALAETFAILQRKLPDADAQLILDLTQEIVATVAEKFQTQFCRFLRENLR